MAASLVLAVGMVPGRQARAQLAGEPTVFTTSRDANHYGSSDVRAYLNNGLADVADDGTVSSKNFKLDSTADSSNTSGYGKHFTDAEFALIQPVRYMTTVVDSSKNVTSAYELIDRFCLASTILSGAPKYISWQSEDIADENIKIDAAYILSAQRCYPGQTWLRSHYGAKLTSASVSSRGGTNTSLPIDYNFVYLAAVFKINLNPIIFASAALPKDVVGDGDSGSKVITISGSTLFNSTNDSSALPAYGMYPKKQSTNTSFSVGAARVYNGELYVRCSGGEVGQYVMVQVIKPDSLENGTTTYVFAQKMSSSSCSLQININEAWGEGSVNENDTVKVWMKDDSGSLAAATTPVTFVNGSETETGAVTNPRVFAMKKDLQCAQGNSALGTAATHQKIYFGSHNGVPLEFWIAGRETAANDGELDPNGEIMTLYQATSVERSLFNASTSNYTVADKPAVTLRLEQASVATSPYPADQITFMQGDTALNKANLVWLHRTPGTNAWLEGMPKVGTYEVRCYTPGTDNYERTYSNVVNFINKETPTRECFTITGPESQPYDGQAKVVTVTLKPGITGMGKFTVIYYIIDAEGNETELTGPPTDVGKYKVKIHVEEGDNYNEAYITVLFY